MEHRGSLVYISSCSLHSHPAEELLTFFYREVFNMTCLEHTRLARLAPEHVFPHVSPCRYSVTSLGDCCLTRLPPSVRAAQAQAGLLYYKSGYQVDMDHSPILSF